MTAGSRASKGSAKKRASEADLANGAVREKKKRKRKPKLPKNFDPENPGPKPDPERWLPKWQRSDFKKKRNRRREKASLCQQLVLQSLHSAAYGLLTHSLSPVMAYIATYYRPVRAYSVYPPGPKL